MHDLKRVLLAAAPFLTQTEASNLALPLCARAAVDHAGEGLFDDLSAYSLVYEELMRQKIAESTGILPRPTQGGARITEEHLREMGDSGCLWYFRMTANELIQLSGSLDLPEKIVTKSGYASPRLEAISLAIARFRTSGDEYDLVTRFLRSQPAISEIVNTVVLLVVDSWRHLLDFDHEHLLSPANLERYAAAIHGAGAPLKSVWGFIDCTIRRIARPSWHQRQAYTGYKKYHALKYQAIILPNGLFAHLYGPTPGPRNDNKLVEWSGILKKCQKHAVRPSTSAGDRPTSRYLQIFGDPAYGRSAQILSGWSSDNITPERELFNIRMSQHRISVEHGFALVLMNWPFLRAWWKHRLYQCPVGAYYIFGVLMTNALNCLRPNEVSQTYQCRPPSLSEYFHH